MEIKIIFLNAFVKFTSTNCTSKKSEFLLFIKLFLNLLISVCRGIGLFEVMKEQLLSCKVFIIYTSTFPLCIWTIVGHLLMLNCCHVAIIYLNSMWKYHSVCLSFYGNIFKSSWNLIFRWLLNLYFFF